MRILIIILLFAINQQVQSQDFWDLEKCINHAMENSISVQQTELAVQNAEINLKQTKMSRLPNLNGSTNYGFNFGRTIDPTSNDFDNQTIGFNSLSLNSNFPIFQGNEINHSVERDKLNMEASKMDSRQASYDISLTVANSFLAVLFSEEQLENARKRLELTRDQLDNTDRLIAAGSLPKNDRLDILAQVARDEQSIVDAENAVINNMVTLKHLLRIDPIEEIELTRPEILLPVETDPDDLTIPQVYDIAYDNQPFIKAGEYRRRAAEFDIKIAKSQLLPSLSFGASVSSNYSSVGKTIDGFSDLPFSQDVTVTGIPGVNDPVDLTLTSIQEVANLVDNHYFSQLDENFGYGVGVSLSVPIFNRNAFKYNIERQKLNAISTDLANEQNVQSLKTSISQAIADARAAKRNLDASQKTRDALQASYGNTERKFELGAVNTLEYRSAKSALDQAEVDLIIARYDYVFKMKVVDYYMGKKIILK